MEVSVSFCHVRLIRVQDDQIASIYSVESSDFDPDFLWTKIGKLKINKLERTYEFESEGEFLKHKIVPPWFYGLSREEQKKLSETQFKDHGFGSWTMRVHHYVTTFIEDEKYPEKHPLIHFDEK